MFKIVNSDSDLARKTKYGAWLRVIGQDLSSRSFVRFVIEVEEMVFVVRGLDAKGKMSARKGILRESVGKKSTDLPVNKSENVSGADTVRYTRDELDRLERKWWWAKGTARDGTPDIKTLSESLRTIGKFLDSGRFKVPHKCDTGRDGNRQTSFGIGQDVPRC